MPLVSPEMTVECRSPVMVSVRTIVLPDLIRTTWLLVGIAPSVQLRIACRSVAMASRPVGVDGGESDVTTIVDDGVDSGPAPSALIARTWNV